MTKSTPSQIPPLNPIDPDTGEVTRLYNGRRVLRPTVDASHDGRTKSEFAKSCDLKERIHVYQERGVLPGMRTPPSPATDVDLSAYPDSYHDALNLVARVGQHFASLPSEIRTRFHNDPQLYLASLESQEKAFKEASIAGSKALREASAYEIEEKLSTGRRKAAERDQRVKQALQEPSTPPKEG